VPKERQHKRSSRARPDRAEAEPAGHLEQPAEQHKDKRSEYLTARQLAEVLQIGESTVHRLRRNGVIPAVVLTQRLIRYNLRDVRNALRPIQASQSRVEHEQEPSPQLSFEDLEAGLRISSNAKVVEK